MSAGGPEPLKFGKYELLERIGSGGMAEIHKARVAGPDGFEKTLVIKKILPEFARNPAFVRMLIAEAKVTSLLQHPNIVQIYELGEHRGQYYIAMELVDGADLLAILARCTRERLRVPTEIALFIISEVCKGLAHAHAAADADGNLLNVIHRDVSPSNILISFHGDIKIMDFGVARADLGGGSTAQGPEPGVLKGKLGYMSPEQVTAQSLDRRSDVFALGIVLFECLTLKRLFVGKTDAQTLMNIRDAKTDRKFKKHSYIPKPIRNILRRALARDPAARFQTATDFQEAILDYLFENRTRVSARSVANFLHQVLATDGSTHSPSLPERPLGPPPTAPTTPTPDGTPTQKTPDGVPIPDLPPNARLAVERPANLRRVDLTRATFHLKNDGEAVYGPLSFDRLTTLLHGRCVAPREWVSVNGSDWLRVSEVRAIVELAPSLFEEEHDRPLHDGPTNRVRTPSLFHQLFAARSAGKLKLTRGTVSKAIYFQKGIPVYVNSNIKAELFGPFLVGREIVTAEQVEHAIERAGDPNTHVGAALVEAGHLTVVQVQDALREQFKDRLLEVFCWENGWYEFFEGVLPREAVVLPDAATPQLMMQGIRRHYDLAALRTLFADYRDRPIVVPTRLAQSGNRLGLTDAELEVRAQLTSDVTLDGLLGDGADADREHLVTRTLFALHQSDRVAFRSGRPAATTQS